MVGAWGSVECSLRALSPASLSKLGFTPPVVAGSNSARAGNWAKEEMGAVVETGPEGVEATSCFERLVAEAGMWVDVGLLGKLACALKGCIGAVVFGATPGPRAQASMPRSTGAKG